MSLLTLETTSPSLKQSGETRALPEKDRTRLSAACKDVQPRETSQVQWHFGHGGRGARSWRGPSGRTGRVGGLHSAQPAPSPGSSPPPVFLQASRDLWALLLSLCLGLFCVLVNWAVSTQSGGPRLRLHVWELGEASNSWSGESPRTCGRSMTA